MNEVYPVVTSLGKAGFDVKVVCEVLAISRLGTMRIARVRIALGNERTNG